MRSFKLFALGAAMICMAGSASAETLRVGMECTYAPFNYKTADGELAGYDVDVAKGVANIIGADLEYVCQQWDGMIPALLANKFDLIVASMSITNDRLKKMDFSVPYRFSVGQLVGPKDSGWKLFDDNSDPITENFKGLRVGLERSSTYADWFTQKVKDAEVVYYDATEPLYLDLQNGRVDMIMVNPMKAYLKFLSKEDGSGFEFVSPEIDEEEIFGVGVGIGMRKGNDELKERINVAVKQLINDGSLESYAKKIFPFALHKPEWGE